MDLRQKKESLFVKEWMSQSNYVSLKHTGNT